jgi:hypothetical protein
VSRQLRAGLVVAVLAVPVAGCGGGSSGGELPPGPSGTPAAAASSAASPSASPGELVLSSYLRFWDAVVAANKASDPSLPALAAASGDPQLSRVRKAIRVNRQQNLSLRGTVTHTPEPVKLAGAAATVEDCYDVSSWQPVNVTTGDPIDATDANGTGRYRARYTLRRSSGGWIVTDQVALGGC